MTPRRLAIAAWLWIAVLGTLLAVILTRAEAANRVLYRNTVAVGRYRTRNAADRIGAELVDLEAVAHALVGQLQRGEITPAGLEKRLGGLLEAAPTAAERLGVLFEPAGEPGPGRLFAPYAARAGAAVRTYRYDEKWGDYTILPWYRLDQPGGAWIEPHWARDAPLLLVDYQEPFRLPGAKAASGLVRLQVSLESMSDLVEAMGLGISGYGFLVSAKTVLLVDPRAELIREGKTLVALAEESGEAGQAFIAQCALKGVAGVAEATGYLSDQKVLTLVEPIPSVGWTVGVSLFEDEMALIPKDQGWVMVKVVSLAIAVAWGVLFLAFGGPRLKPAGLWWTAGTGSLVVAVGIGVLFHHAYASPRDEWPRATPVMDPVGLQKFKQRFRTARRGPEVQGEAQYIPTGVYLETLEITGPSQVKLTGMIWQRLPRNTPRDQRGVALPETAVGEVSLGQEVADGDSLVQYYPFRVTIQPDLQTGVDYPFDHLRVRLRIWPKAWFGDQVLVPDLAAYPLLAFRAGPGLDPELDVPGWKLVGSGFGYVLESYNTNFGHERAGVRREAPELVFDVHLKRSFLSPTIVAFLPILAVASLLFTHLVTVSLEKEQVQATGYGYFNYLRNVSALFFTLVVAQFNIRNRIVAEGVIYLEWFYFIMYGVILASCVDALVFALDREYWLRANDNAWAKLAFWPLLMASFYLVAIGYVL